MLEILFWAAIGISKCSNFRERPGTILKVYFSHVASEYYKFPQDEFYSIAKKRWSVFSLLPLQCINERSIKQHLWISMKMFEDLKFSSLLIPFYYSILLPKVVTLALCTAIKNELSDSCCVWCNLTFCPLKIFTAFSLRFSSFLLHDLNPAKAKTRKNQESSRTRSCTTKAPVSHILPIPFNSAGWKQ